MTETEKPVSVVEWPGLSRMAKARADFKFVADDLLVLPKGMQLLKEPDSSVVEVEFMPEPSIILRRQDVHIEDIKDMSIKNLMKSLGLVSPEAPTDGVVEVATEDGVIHEIPVVDGEVRSDDPIYVIRHVRSSAWFLTLNPKELDDLARSGDLLYTLAQEVVERQVLPTGGVTMLFKIEPWNKKFSVAFAICHEHDLFNKKLSVRIARQRLEASDFFTVEDYSTDYSLVTNLYMAISRYLRRAPNSAFVAEIEEIKAQGIDPHFIYVPVANSRGVVEGEDKQANRLAKIFDHIGSEYVASE